MTFMLCFRVAFILSLWTTVWCDILKQGVLQMECREHYFMVAIDLAVTGPNPQFEAVDMTGGHPLTQQYAAECGYSINVLSFLGVVELRSSYFSCHTEKNGAKFLFYFKLNTNLDGNVTNTLNATCSPPVPWAPREVSCETNYMEVSIEYESTCPHQLSEDWSSLRPAYSTSPSEWQVSFQKPGVVLAPMNFTEARKQGYVFELKNGRFVFRTPYGQPNSFITKDNGVQVEVVQASVFSRRGWFVIIVDLVTACSIDQGMLSDGYMMWDTPEALYSSLGSTQISIGLNGDLVGQVNAKQKGFIMEKRNNTIHIGIPYNAVGGYRKTLVSGGIFEFRIFQMYLKQVSVDEYQRETVVKFHRTLVTPLTPYPLVTEDKTVLQEGMFTVFLGNVPDDVDLTSIQLNGEQFMLPLPSESTFMITEEAQPDNTFSYILKMLFSDPLVVQEFSKEHAAMLHQLNINYTLTVSGSEPYHYTTSVTALLDVSPPVFEANCTAAGINFMLVHQPSDCLWEFSIGADLLTTELVTRCGYIMNNSSQTLQLNAPLFTPGYDYRDVSLRGFYGTFEILVRDRDTLRVRASTVKTCYFESREFIMCSTDGMMTVAADLSEVIPSGQMPVNFHLYNKLCVPNEVNGTRVLFSFPVNSCGSVIKLRGNVTYRNKIFHTLNNVPSGDDKGVTVQCSYPLNGLSRLFSVYRFESDTEGKGTIIHDVQATPGEVVPTPAKPTPKPETTAAPKIIIPNYLPAYHPPAHYIRVTRVHSLPNVFYRGEYLQSVRVGLFQIINFIFILYFCRF
uniref:Zona pellucida protein AX 4 n=1 Tax=Oryzias latipes TaxID=8090 RepID=A0A3P9KKL7_ORYLA